MSGFLFDSREPADPLACVRSSPEPRNPLFPPRLDIQSRSARLQQQFEEFDAAHPEVYRLFRRFACELMSRGRTRYSADAILHRIRWEFDVNREKDGGFRINDHFSSRFSRRLAEEDPRFAEFFEFRRLRSA